MAMNRRALKAVRPSQATGHEKVTELVSSTKIQHMKQQQTSRTTKYYATRLPLATLWLATIVLASCILVTIDAASQLDNQFGRYRYVHDNREADSNQLEPAVNYYAVDDNDKPELASSGRRMGQRGPITEADYVEIFEHLSHLPPSILAEKLGYDNSNNNNPDYSYLSRLNSEDRVQAQALGVTQPPVLTTLLEDGQEGAPIEQPEPKLRWTVVRYPIGIERNAQETPVYGTVVDGGEQVLKDNDWMSSISRAFSSLKDFVMSPLTDKPEVEYTYEQKINDIKPHNQAQQQVSGSLDANASASTSSESKIGHDSGVKVTSDEATKPKQGNDNDDSNNNNNNNLENSSMASLDRKLATVAQEMSSASASSKASADKRVPSLPAAMTTTTDDDDDQVESVDEADMSRFDKLFSKWAMLANNREPTTQKVSLLRSTDMVLPLEAQDNKPRPNSLLGKYIYAPEHHWHLNSPGQQSSTLDSNPRAYYQAPHAGPSRYPISQPNDMYFLVMVGAFCVMAMTVVLAAGLFAYKLQQGRKCAMETDYPTYGVVGPNNNMIGNINSHNKPGSDGHLGGGYFSSSNPTFNGLVGLGGILSGKSKNNNKTSDSPMASSDQTMGSRDSGIATITSKPGLNKHSAAVDLANTAQVAKLSSNFMAANQNAARMYHYQHQKQQMITSDKAGSGRHGSASDLESDEDNEDGNYTVYECPGLASAHEMEIKNPLFNDDRSP